MKNKSIKGLLGMGASVLALAISASVVAEECKPLHTFKTIQPGELTVTSVVLPPFAYDDQARRFSGVDGEIVQQIAKDNCLKVNHIVTDSAASIQYVVASRSDISVGAWYRTFERSKVMGISDPVYLEQTAIYSRDGADTFDQLTNRKVGTVTGYLWVPELKKLYGNKLSLYPNAVALSQDLNSGRIDAAVNTYAIGAESQKKGGVGKDIQIKVAKPDEKVKSSVYPAQTAFIYSKSNPDLGAAINATIKDLRESGKLASLLTDHGLRADGADVGEPRYADQ
ncbi:amino acid ABC transporter substrate-binding protein [Pseudomonas lurida]|jgi:polar amino acid transport system substrate-binding protein|uniref:substrate-binding periplasmic protein n=1 Tax=Pseudomonas lurida TaxID=244566 RepID=UPI0016549285|nr:transporter substrate-binding domain-containing protein [Pseudomonas lurida]MBC3924192.1 amino acid ABC transporter substrate-binding protein [Pseudomonas lurida]